MRKERYCTPPHPTPTLKKRYCTPPHPTPTLPASMCAGDPLSMCAGDPLSMCAGDPLSMCAGDPLSMCAGDPLSMCAGDPFTFSGLLSASWLPLRFYFAQGLINSTWQSLGLFTLPAISYPLYSFRTCVFLIVALAHMLDARVQEVLFNVNA